MKALLFLAPSPPCPGAGGGSLRMFQMLRFLGRRFEVDLLCSEAPDVDTETSRLGGYCRDVEIVPGDTRPAWRRKLRLGPYEREPRLGDAVRRRLASGAYAAVHVEKPAMLPYLPRGLGVPVVLDTFAYGAAGAFRALRHERGTWVRLRNLIRLLRFAAFDAFCWPKTHCILVVSEVDRQRCLRQRPARRVVVVPNGIDCAATRPAPRREDVPPILVFTGDMGFDPNVHAAHRLVDEVLPRVRRSFPEVVLWLVGRRPDPSVVRLARPGVVVTGEVPDMLPYLHGAAVYVAPLRTGAGTRTKLLEAMAAGLPIVTTRIGLEGIDAEDGRQIIVADEPASMADAVVHLLRNPVRRQSIGSAARQLAEQRYDWDRCLTPLTAMYGDLLAPKVAR